MLFSLFFVLLNLLLLTTARRLPPGPNCKGSILCNDDGPLTNRTFYLSSVLTAYIDTIPSDRWYTDHQMIACTHPAHEVFGDHAVCAFLEGTAGAYASDIKLLAPSIGKHGCNVCGNVPYGWHEGEGKQGFGVMEARWGRLKFDIIYHPKGCDDWNWQPEGACGLNDKEPPKEDPERWHETGHH